VNLISSADTGVAALSIASGGPSSCSTPSDAMRAWVDGQLYLDAAKPGVYRAHTGTCNDLAIGYLLPYEAGTVIVDCGDSGVFHGFASCPAGGISLCTRGDDGGVGLCSPCESTQSQPSVELLAPERMPERRLRHTEWLVDRDANVRRPRRGSRRRRVSSRNGRLHRAWLAHRYARPLYVRFVANGDADARVLTALKLAEVAAARSKAEGTKRLERALRARHMAISRVLSTDRLLAVAAGCSGGQRRSVIHWILRQDRLLIVASPGGCSRYFPNDSQPVAAAIFLCHVSELGPTRARRIGHV
jgi:hypothetical protein